MERLNRKLRFSNRAPLNPVTSRIGIRLASVAKVTSGVSGGAEIHDPKGTCILRIARGPSDRGTDIA